MRKWMFSIFVPALAFAGMQANAQTGIPSHPCAATQDRDARLSCYDRVFPVTPDVVEAEAERATSAFGMRAQPARIDAPDEVRARVARLVQDARGARTVTFDNGQVWRLTESGTRGRLAEGDTVTVREAALGSYMLVTSGGAVLRARRVR